MKNAFETVVKHLFNQFAYYQFALLVAVAYVSDLDPALVLMSVRDASNGMWPQSHAWLMQFSTGK